MLLGVWVIAFLFLGFPSSWHNVLAVLTGILMIILAYRLPSEAKPENKTAVPFIEHKNPPVPTEVMPEKVAENTPTDPIESNTPEPSITPETANS